MKEGGLGLFAAEYIKKGRLVDIYIDEDFLDD